jgi:hypothetical protein
MLVRFAKLVGGLRLLVAEMAPLVVTSASVLSVRSAAYLVGFTLGSVASVWLPIIAVLISVTGLFSLFSGSDECDAYRAQIAEIDQINFSVMQEYQKEYFDWEQKIYIPYMQRTNENYKICNDILKDQGSYAGYNPYSSCIENVISQIRLNAPQPPPFPSSLLISYPCAGGSGGGPDCPANKKVWLQVIWGSPTGNFSDSKGCFLVAYSQDAPDLPIEVEYNPFLPKKFVELRPLPYYSIKGDRFRNLEQPTWKNLESVEGWDKGYWIAESVDPECRGWSPGWSRKIK